VGKRFWELDAARGIAVVLMVLFHSFLYWQWTRGIVFPELNFGWLLAQRTAGTMFLLIVGISMSISYSRAVENKINLFKKYFFRAAFIFSLGVIITVFTALFFPTYIVWFGVLHLIGVSVFLSFLALHYRLPKLFIAAAAITIGFLSNSIFLQTPLLLWLGFPPTDFATFDYYPLLPWFGVVVAGAWLGEKIFPNGIERKWRVEAEGNNFVAKILCFLGRNSLAIYFIHLPAVAAFFKIVS
jgi:uncharacterized membrane protein